MLTMLTPVRILTLLILAAGLASGHPIVLLVGAALLIGTGLWAWHGYRAFDAQMLLRMLRRVRWLLLAILILYGWFTPGAAMLPVLGQFSPSLEGVQQGLLRVAALLAIVAAVYLLLATTPRGELVAGLLWYGRPLRRLGVDDTRFAVRLVLALEAVPQVQTLARTALMDKPQGASRMQRLGRAATVVFEATLARAEQSTGAIAVPDSQPVPLWQWSLPGVLAALLVAAATV
ncbi:MAG: hypothetical protein HZB57_12285 [Gammaproteobacteria bacterium]|nr:hypothetical protein [Gammaproteobacteria bacterium]